MSAKTVSKEAAQTVSSRQWIRLVVAYLLIPLILLICGGDLGWWQAWLYSLLILAAGIGGRMWAEQRHPGITAERQNKESFHDAKVWDNVLAPLMAVSFVDLEFTGPSALMLPNGSWNSTQQFASGTTPSIR